MTSQLSTISSIWFLLLRTVVVYNSYLRGFSAGVIRCICTTTDCQQDRQITCETNHVCYVQLTPAPSGELSETKIIRGCIDQTTPLLCENRPPQAYAGTDWPILLCCRESWCNREVMPNSMNTFTNHDSIYATKSTVSSVHYSNPSADANGSNLDNEEVPKIQSTSISSLLRSSSSVNAVLWYGSRDSRSYALISVVAVVGACVMVGLVGFAVSILRRRGGDERNSSSSDLATTDSQHSLGVSSKPLSLFDVTNIRQMSWRKACKYSPRIFKTKIDMSTETVVSSDGDFNDEECRKDLRTAFLSLSVGKGNASPNQLTSDQESGCVDACLLNNGALRRNISAMNCDRTDVDTERGLSCYQDDTGQQFMNVTLMGEKRTLNDRGDHDLLSDKSCNGSQTPLFYENQKTVTSEVIPKRYKI